MLVLGSFFFSFLAAAADIGEKGPGSGNKYDAAHPCHRVSEEAAGKCRKPANVK
jgi:hypothetical protein